MNLDHIISYLEFIGFGFLCAMVISFLLTPLVMRVGNTLGFVDHPDERRIHSKPTPRCGGVAVFIAYSLTVMFICRFMDVEPQDSSIRIWVKSIIPVSIPLIIIGLIDDRWEIKPIFKLLGQILVGALAWDQGINLGKLLGLEFPIVLDAAATIFLYVAAMNAYNLIDGMDGVAGGLAAITSFGLGTLNLIIGNEGMAVMCFALTGSCLGFLRYNFHPARIFLGDTGSMYIGYLLMSLTLVAHSRTTAAIMMIVPLLTMGVPMIDTGLAIWRRSVRRAMDPEKKLRVSVADKDHLHHRLARRGFTQRRVAITLYCIQALLFAVGLLWVFVRDYRMAIFTIAFFAGTYVVLRYLASLEMNDSGRWIVDGIRRPGRMQIYRSFMPIFDVTILSIAIFFLSWILSVDYPELSMGRLMRETAPPLVGGAMILIWATRYYRLQWTRARAIDFFSLGLIITAGITVGIAISPLPLHHTIRETILFSLVILTLSVPPMVIFRAIPRLTQDLLQYHDRKSNHTENDTQHRVLIYGAGYGYTLITRAESFDDSKRKQHYCLVGLIDDDPYLRGRVVHGHQVLGTLQNLKDLVKEKNVSEIMVSTQLSESNKTELLQIAEEINLKVTLRLFSNQVLRDLSLAS
ncbi:hypothetical protein P0Y35_00615 [Kiritimatiellaeota bacterium B1221]|nr:hypothetical protein [Kiritimatiellaeota bacterium B1221]